MAIELKTNTATRITVGPFLDKTDGITPEVALTTTNEHLTLVVDTAGVPTLVLDANATASGGSNNMVHITNDDAGYYDLELTAAQLNYLGNAKLSINYVTDHLPVFHEISIVSAQYWDAKYGTGNLSADLKAITAGVDFSAAMKTSLNAATPASIQNIPATGTGLTAIPWNAAWDTEVQSEAQDAITASALATAANLATVAGYLDTEVAAILADTNELQTDWVNGGRLDLLLDAIKVPTDKLTFTVANQIDANVLDWKGAVAPAMTGDAYAETVLVHAHATTIEADTNELQTDWANAGRLDTILDTAAGDAHLSADSISDVWAHIGTVSSLAVELLLERLYEMVNNKMIVTEATGVVALRNIADSANVATGVVADLGATTQRDGLTWV